MEMSELPDETKDREIERLKRDVHGLRSEIIGKRKGKRFSIKKDRQNRERLSTATTLNNVSKPRKRRKQKKTTLESIFV